jgi:hypothetical protein
LSCFCLELGAPLLARIQESGKQHGGHTGIVQRVAWSPKKKNFILSCSHDKTGFYETCFCVHASLAWTCFFVPASSCCLVLSCVCCLLSFHLVLGCVVCLVSAHRILSYLISSFLFSSYFVFVSTRLFLSCLVLSNLVLSCGCLVVILRCLVVVLWLSCGFLVVCLVVLLSCLVQYSPVLSRLVLSCLIFSRLVLVLSCLVLSCVVLPCVVLSCLVLCYVVLFLSCGFVFCCVVLRCLLFSCACLLLLCLYFSYPYLSFVSKSNYGMCPQKTVGVWSVHLPAILIKFYPFATVRTENG